MDKEILKTLLLKWDRKHTGFLKNIYKVHVQTPSFMDDIIDLYATSHAFEHATSWMIKHHVDQGKTLKEEHVDQVLESMGTLTYWESQLHVLQIIPKVFLTQKQVTSSEPVIRQFLKSEKKFVKAAAFEAYYEVVKVWPKHKRDYLSLCEEALLKESASIKSKVKKILKKLKIDAK